MKSVGIEAINFFGGLAYLNVKELAEYRKLDTTRFENLLMEEKTVVLPYEDPITYGVNAAKPIIDSLSEEDREKIEMVITCTESGIDFGKSISSYIHHYLGLNRNCRLFELKNACYSGTAGFQMAINFILSGSSPGAKALVIATDITRFVAVDGGEALTADWSFAEPSSGAGAAAILVSDNPLIFQIDVGANGYYGYEVMDTCRPIPDSEAGNSDLSLLSYLDCCEQSFLQYQKRVEGVDYKSTFDYLAFHTPFGGMVKGAHRSMMRKLAKASPAEIDEDFNIRVMPGMKYCKRVGNIMGATIFLSLLGLLDYGNFDSPKRIGCFSYGSGCCSEFYSGVVTAAGQRLQQKNRVEKQLNSRYKLNMELYEILLKKSGLVKFGTRNTKLDFEVVPGLVQKSREEKILYLDQINEFHREYIWL
ncbi:polyketide biosynthesis 3-hydroxy-3-methylglutaryl-ACP synthase PksG [Anaerocolumna cellulosilytica]|uniref:Polyketide biosynthesis 3-hydroxy-3-methylglutaryl-ACP synthase PksG n=1 Tax=Anaerocolumna cellulosilytica TaxID=433286 RepID=A0A6S6QWB3_9FIRM|nr:hydroxymethylglutaryl-CoA synthase family protein [Anaerocolumna cellulosilytica]MBB5196734.1 polyketide biosynthesis 3-hydroxy-3-methylglutaryl-CoA synthase-like enzyme PksG [Anaerocolumna cellulosilytica]BCJ93996.1 polyketide biosynthesis 3-hydroxy-3-methylglutaryl-ACP synthase PksG [Anaerocolumna cellulosilytica]